MRAFYLVIVGSALVAGFLTAVNNRTPTPVAAPRDWKDMYIWKDQTYYPTHQEDQNKVIREIPLIGDPRPVRTIPMVVQQPPPEPPPPDPEPEAAHTEPDIHPEPKPHISQSDICARTGGRRVEYNHGRSWRCAYKR